MEATQTSQGEAGTAGAAKGAPKGASGSSGAEEYTLGQLLAAGYEPLAHAQLTAFTQHTLLG